MGQVCTQAALPTLIDCSPTPLAVRVVVVLSHSWPADDRGDASCMQPTQYAYSLLSATLTRLLPALIGGMNGGRLRGRAHLHAHTHTDLTGHHPICPTLFLQSARARLRASTSVGFVDLVGSCDLLPVKQECTPRPAGFLSGVSMPSGPRL